MNEPLYQLIYVSVIAPDAHPTCVADIIRTSRANNSLHGITGLLVFDGGRFCQYIEGAEDVVRRLSDAICEDPRHEQFIVLHEGPFDGPRLFSDWSMGYALSHEEGSLPGLALLRGLPAIAGLQGLIPVLDLEP